MPVPSHPDLRSAVAALPPGHPSTWTVEQAREGHPGPAGDARTKLDAWTSAAIATFDAGDGARADGHRTTGDWLGKTTRISNPGAEVHTARDLRDALPLTAAALEAGLISAEQVRVIRRARRVFDDFTEIEETLVEYAKISTAKQLRTLVDVMIQQYAPDGSDEDAEKARDKRELYLIARPGGLVAPQGPAGPCHRREVEGRTRRVQRPVRAGRRPGRPRPPG
ncbi:MAG: DUF222 domain-containing protein [Candidatus Nanopelagicales bacterium]